MARILKDSDLAQIAEDILSEKVLTSKDLDKASGGDQELYLHLLKSTFTDKALHNCMADIIQAHQDKEFKDVLWFAYFKDQDENLGFTKAYFIFGDDYRRLLEFLIEEVTSTTH